MTWPEIVVLGGTPCPAGMFGIRDVYVLSQDPRFANNAQQAVPLTVCYPNY